MSDVSRAEAESVLEKAEEVLERPRVESEKLEELAGKLREKLAEGENFSSGVKKVKEALEEVDRSLIDQGPEMQPEDEREAREEGPREEQYGNLSS